MDTIDRAIADAEQAPTVDMVQLGPLTLTPGGRPVVVAVPADATAEELLDLAAWVAHPNGLRSALPRRPASRLILPR